MTETPTTEQLSRRQRWRATRARRREGRGFLRRWLRRAVLAGVAVVVLIVAGLAVAYATTEIPDPKKIATAQTTVVQYAGGEQMGTFGAQNRVDVPLREVPDYVQKAVLAAENRDFYAEPGISPSGILRAAIANLRGGGIGQGGSTITQQYVKNAYLTQDRTLARKYKEILIAVKLDRSRSKNEILGDYLNTIYFGRGANGIEVATQTYFGVPASQLTLEQGAVLAAIIRAPAAYDPTNHPQALADRFRYVLNGMVSKGWLSPEQAAAARVPPALPPAAAKDTFGNPQGYLIKQVQDELAARGFSDEEVSRSGFIVTTTIRKQMQDAAEQSVTSVLGGRRPPGLFSPLVAIEPGTGRVLAEYAGPDYVTRPLNGVTQATAQAGSSFKPFVLTAALREGIGLRTRFDGSSPLEVPGYGKPVENFKGEDYGRVDLVTATADSINTVYVQLALAAKLPAVKQAAVDAGIDPAEIDLDREGASLALGTPSVHPLEMAEAYATLAAQGVHAAPFLVERVARRNGSSVYQARPRTRQAIAADVSADVTFALQQVVNRGTAQAAQLRGGRPAAGKTGTTSDNTAAWFVGYTPQVATAVALFFPDNAPLRDVAGVTEVTGGSLPAQIWKSFTDAALAGQPQRDFPDAAYVGSSQASSGGGGSADSGGTPIRSPRPRRTTYATPSTDSSQRASAQPSPLDSASASPAASRSARPSGSASASPRPSRSTTSPRPAASPTSSPG